MLAGTLLAVVAPGTLGGRAFGRLSAGGFSDPDAQSSRARGELERVFDAGDPNLVLLVTAEHGSVDDPSVAAAGVALTRQLAGEPSVQQASSYWTLGPAPSLRSHDGRQALVLARIAGNEDHLPDRAGPAGPGVRLRIAGIQRGRLAILIPAGLSEQNR